MGYEGGKVPRQGVVGDKGIMQQRQRATTVHNVHLNMIGAMGGWEEGGWAEGWHGPPQRWP